VIGLGHLGVLGQLGEFRVDRIQSRLDPPDPFGERVHL